MHVVTKNKNETATKFGSNGVLHKIQQVCVTQSIGDLRRFSFSFGGKVDLQRLQANVCTDPKE